LTIYHQLLWDTLYGKVFSEKIKETMHRTKVVEEKDQPLDFIFQTKLQ